MHLKRFLFAASLVSGLAVSAHARAANINILTLSSTLGNYDVFVQNDLGTASSPYLSDSYGPIVAGGSVYLGNFGLNTGNASAAYGLIAGQNLVMSGGSAGGRNFYVGGTTTLSGGATLRGNLYTQTLNASGGSVYGNVVASKDITLRASYINGSGTSSAGGNVSLSNGASFTNGAAKLTYGGTVKTDANAFWEVPSSTTHSSSPVTVSAPIDIGATYSAMVTASSQLASLKATAGTTAATAWGTLSLTGGNAKLDVFDINASQLNYINNFTITAPSTATVVVNVLGTDSIAWSGGFSLSGVGSSNVLLNFASTQSIALSNIGILGSVLAPHATITGSGGQFDGAVIASYIVGNTEFDPSGKFTGDISAVPLPGALPLFGGAMACLWIMARGHGRRGRGSPRFHG